jgi:hypothetical protein
MTMVGLLCYIALMKTKLVIGFVIGLLVFGSVQVAAAAVDKKAAFDAFKRKALDFHASLLPKASPAVRSKISASALAARKYLVKCDRNCALYAFLTGDLKSRFKRLTKRERDLLMALVLAETLKTGGTDSERMMLELEDLFAKRELTIEVMSKIMETDNSTLQSILDNF